MLLNSSIGFLYYNNRDFFRGLLFARRSPVAAAEE